MYMCPISIEWLNFMILKYLEIYHYATHLLEKIVSKIEKVTAKPVFSFF